MRRSLFSLILRTRVSSSFLVITGIFLALAVFVITISIPTARPISSEFPVFLGIFSFISLIVMIGTALILKKSDFDFLFTSPIPARRLSLDFFLAALVINSMYAFFLMYFLPSLEYPAFLIPAAIDLWLVMMINVSIAALMRKLKIRNRLMAIGFILIWYLLPGFIRFPYSPTSTFAGYPVYGTVIDVVLAASLVLYNIMYPPRISYYYRSVTPRTSNIRRSISFAGTSPIGAIYRFNLKMVGGASTLRVGAVSRNYTGRINTGLAVWMSIAVAALYGIAFIFIPKSLRSIIEIYYILYGIAIYPLMRGVGWIQTERIWLALMSLPATVYFRHMALAKAISTIIILMPLIIVNMILFLILREYLFAEMAVMTLAVSPSVLILGFYLAGFVNPYQIIDIGELPPSSRYSGRNFVVGFVIAPVTVVTILSVFIPGLYLYASVSFIAVAAVLIAIPGVQNRLKRAILSHNLL
ncbi:hypothetical membrane protein [Thermoplasma acidophilum]|uniref:Hypothetical membrane protein n=1 Tax=Thermoplasma acidophilum (strain ATCC 25905 / DSM 1728 / JCM 9062 / NBRC 15155 / AMRC-C165) TaxID=273075 RepID=Q9HLJ6_THEAC|nr:hypothetical protein [Thermoplasma acidophilum]MCY0851449.1 hypothetical protein [Thermoplasma acidophilum]CAC11377.1 hypothetical membrane protein [Thermoplasma acidophilum]